MLNREQQATLNDLRWHWDDAYMVDCSGGIWTAISKDHRKQVLRDASSAVLRNMMRDDYSEHAPGRPVGQPDGRGV